MAVVPAMTGCLGVYTCQLLAFCLPWQVGLAMMATAMMTMTMSMMSMITMSMMSMMTMKITPNARYDLCGLRVFLGNCRW